MIEPTTACDLRCLTCPVRDFSGDVTWRDAYRDGGASFLAWDTVRRAKQHTADGLKRAIPVLATYVGAQGTRTTNLLLRGRTPPSRRGTLPIDVLKRVVSEASPGIERLDFFNYGEPFLYRHLLEALRHIRAVTPATIIAISTDGMQVSPRVEEAMVAEELVDWLVFSVDGSDEESYRRYRIRGSFDIAFSNLARFHRRADGTRTRVIWQYVVFSWNDSDNQLRRAIAMAADLGVQIWFDFAHTWGRSTRRADELRYLTPYLRPFTALPGEPRQEGW
jgi:MoaA/NifB/PqqE/SkfB family radical SAM enzyme